MWWLSTASVIAYVSVRGFLILRAKRGYRDFESSECFCILVELLTEHLCLSQGRQVRFHLRLPVHGVVSALLPVLPHGPTVVPASLSPCTLLLHPALLLCIRPGHLDLEAQNPSASGFCPSPYCFLQLPALRASRVWKPVDQSRMS